MKESKAIPISCWTLLIALPVWFGVDHFELGMLMAAKVIGAALSLATLALLTRTAARVCPEKGEGTSPAVACLYLALSAPFLVWGVGALETPLLGLLLLCVVHCFFREEATVPGTGTSIPYSSCALFFAALTRPEPALLFLPLFAMRTLRNARQRRYLRDWKGEFVSALAFIIPYTIFVGWRWHYYGELLPNTYFAKIHADPLTGTRGWQYLERAAETLNWAPIALAILVPVVLARRLSFQFVLVTFSVVMYIAMIIYDGGDWMPAYRMFAPALPLFSLLVHAGWCAASQLEIEHLNPPDLPDWVAPRSWLKAWRRAVSSLARTRYKGEFICLLRLAARSALVAAAICGSTRGLQSVKVAGFASGFCGLRMDDFPHFQIARWMRREIHDNGLLAIGEAGVIPYYTRLPVLDMFGLLDKRIARLPGIRHHKFSVDYVLARKPHMSCYLCVVTPTASFSPTSPMGNCCSLSRFFCMTTNACMTSEWPSYTSGMRHRSIPGVKKRFDLDN